METSPRILREFDTDTQEQSLAEDFVQALRSLPDFSPADENLLGTIMSRRPDRAVSMFAAQQRLRLSRAGTPEQAAYVLADQLRMLRDVFSNRRG